MLQMKHTALLISALSLVACGGGSGSSNSSTSSSPSAPTTVTGKVIDGYIVGATVCLDVNSNNVCDAGEPQSVSTAGGAYSFQYVGDASQMHVIAQIPVGAVDEDTGPVTQPYTMAAPVAHAEAITPLSTLVTSAIQESKNQISVGEAESSVKASLGMAKPILNYDYKAASDKKTAEVAQVTATAIAQATETLKSSTEIKAVGLTSGDISKKAVEQVKAAVLPQVVTNGETKATISEVKVETIAQVSGKIENIVSETKSGDGNVVNLAEGFKNGIMGFELATGDYINEMKQRVDGYWTGYKNAIKAFSIKFDINNLPSQDPEYQRVLVDNKWFELYEDGEDWTFDGTNWVIANDQIGSASAKPTIKGNCITSPKNSAGTVSDVICAVEKDVSGMKMVDIFPKICIDSSSGKTIDGCNPNALFPTNSKGYDLTMRTETKLTGLGNYNEQFDLNGYFTVWANKKNNWNGYCTQQWNDSTKSCSGSASTVEDFIEWTKNNVQYRGSACRAPFKIESYDKAARKGVIRWAVNTKGCDNNNNYVFDETQEFKVFKIGGRDVMMTPTPLSYRKTSPGNHEPFMIFAKQTSSSNQTGIWSGAYQPSNFKQSIKFDGQVDQGTQIMNRVVFDAIVAQRKAAKFPYSD